MKALVIISSFFACIVTRAQQPVSGPWLPDKGDGWYKNPVIHADYSDPDVIRVGEDYYLISSSFNNVPGLPILQSKDLVNWKIIAHALDLQVPLDHFSSVQHGNGVWAPSIRYHRNEFYIYYPDPDFGIYLIKAKNIRGPWTKPLLIRAGKGLIDPCPLWDDDGKAYIVHAYANSRAGIKSILVIKQMNAEGTAILDSGRLVYDGHKDDPTIEGPKIYKRNGYYYIFAPAGGVSTGWQTVLRSRDIYGPYERRVVMDQGKTTVNGPHQGAWVSTVRGEDWFLHFQDKGAYGRVVHLQPMKWVNDWPVIGEDSDGDGKGEPVPVFRKPDMRKTYPRSAPQTSDEFNESKPGPQWQWQANPGAGWAKVSAGELIMYPVAFPDSLRNLWKFPAILGQKLPAEEFIARLKVRFDPRKDDENFGFLILGTDYASISITRSQGSIYIVCKKCLAADQNNTETEIARYPVRGKEFYLQVRMEKGGLFRFGFSDNAETVTWILETFLAKPGRWVGARMGLFYTARDPGSNPDHAGIDWFRVESL